MKLLNLGCGGNRPKAPWINLDTLRSVLKPGTPERLNLDAEDNYIDHDLNQPLPFLDNDFDGVLASHVIEHFDCWKAVHILTEARRILKREGILVVSVPDAKYFLEVYNEDTRENAERLFGEQISPDEPWHKSFFDYALFHGDHKQVLTRGALQCLLMKAGFTEILTRGQWITSRPQPYYVLAPLTEVMNRRKFSLEMLAVKSL